MKKTLIITLIMLSVFGIAVMFGASYISQSWQKENVDYVNFTTTSPIQQMQQEVKTYQYKKHGEINMPVNIISHSEGMLSWTEAVSICCESFENVFPDIDVADFTFNANLIMDDTYGKVFVVEHSQSLEDTSFRLIQCRADAYTGRIVDVRFEYVSDAIHTKGANNIKDMADYLGKSGFIAKAKEDAQAIGYSDCRIFNIDYQEDETDSTADKSVNIAMRGDRDDKTYILYFRYYCTDSTSGQWDTDFENISYSVNTQPSEDYLDIDKKQNVNYPVINTCQNCGKETVLNHSTVYGEWEMTERYLCAHNYVYDGDYLFERDNYVTYKCISCGKEYSQTETQSKIECFGKNSAPH